MHRARVPLSLAAALAAASCAAEPELDLDQWAEPIVQGEPHPARHRSVGMVIALNSLCTGTLIGARTVLTAAHCVDGVTAEQVTFVVNGKIDRTGGGAAVRSEDGSPCDAVDPGSSDCARHGVAEIALHPSIESEGMNVGNDIALLFLDREPAVSATPIAVQPPIVGDMATLVGYGRLSEDDLASAGIKRRGHHRIDRVEEDAIAFLGTAPSEGNGCNADSGGPALTRAGDRGLEVQAGVISRGICGAWMTSTRVDLHADWILARAPDVADTLGPPTGWHNEALRADVNGDGVVSFEDLRLLQEELTGGGPQVLSGVNRTGLYLDVDGDGRFTAMDGFWVHFALTPLALGAEIDFECLNYPQESGPLAVSDVVVHPETGVFGLPYVGLTSFPDFLEIDTGIEGPVSLTIRDLESLHERLVPGPSLRGGTWAVWDLRWLWLPPGPHELVVSDDVGHAVSVPALVAGPGDTNMNGVVDVRDIARLAAAGKYNTGEPATWAEGDFNGDGVYDARDRLLLREAGLLGQGRYTKFPRHCLYFPLPDFALP